MKSCELCGKKAELYRAIIEESILLVCNECSGFGKVLRKIEQETAKVLNQLSAKKEVLEAVSYDFSGRIKQIREKLGLSQKDFAVKINEKESLVQKLESGRLRPTLDLARRLERIFNVKLVEQVEEESLKLKAVKPSGLTIGDLLQKKD